MRCLKERAKLRGFLISELNLNLFPLFNNIKIEIMYENAYHRYLFTASY
jgi:hypothetical protein